MIDDLHRQMAQALGDVIMAKVRCIARAREALAAYKKALAAEQREDIIEEIE